MPDDPLDLRMPLVAACGWAGGLAGFVRGWVPLALAALTVGLAVALFALGGARPERRRMLLLAVAAGLSATAVAGVTVLRLERVAVGPVPSLARSGAYAEVRGVLTSDARVFSGSNSSFVVQRIRVEEVRSRGRVWQTRVPVLVLSAKSEAPPPELGSRVHLTGLLRVSDDPGDAATLHQRGEVQILASPRVWWRGAAAVRAALRASVERWPADVRALVPALVVGDDLAMSPTLISDFRSVGLTHLTAVSGTNLTLLIGALLVMARWMGVRGRGLYVVGAVGIAGFLVLARAEPSVLRAAAMGVVGLVGMGQRGRCRGGRALGVAVLGLLLLDPMLGVSIGFVLSVSATAGIVYAGPPLRTALAAWAPGWLAEAIAVPTVAQLACTPLVAAISGQVSLAAVAANLAAAPAVGPATVFGLLGGVSGVLHSGLGTVMGAVAGASAWWIVLVAHSGAALPHASITWHASAGPVALLAVLSLAALAAAPRVLRHWPVALLTAAGLAAAVLLTPPVPGWPPPGWVFAACDVGQGDGLVLNAGGGAGVVIDAGPDPGLIDRCLRRLDIDRVPLLVLTHFHADHADGLAGVLRGREVEAIDVTALAVPADRVAAVQALARAAGVSVAVADYAATRQLGDVRLQVVGPARVPSLAGVDDGSGPNNASIVLVAEVGGVRLLLTGDIEPSAQATLARTVAGLQVDVLKVPHHGSRFQDLAFLTSLGARWAVISVGADNDYGHPSPDTVAALEEAGQEVLRTDRLGDILVLGEAAGGVVRARDFE